MCLRRIKINDLVDQLVDVGPGQVQLGPSNISQKAIENFFQPVCLLLYHTKLSLRPHQPLVGLTTGAVGINRTQLLSY